MSVRKKFTQMLFEEMAIDHRIVLVVGDLGWKHFDQLRLTYPDRFINVGAAEQLFSLPLATNVGGGGRGGGGDVLIRRSGARSGIMRCRGRA